MGSYDSTYLASVPQAVLDDEAEFWAEIQGVWETIDTTAILDTLWAYRWTGRPGYDPETMLKAFIASFYLNTDGVNDLMRELKRNRLVRLWCGFPGELPHRTTFNRFYHRLAEHWGLVEEASIRIVEELRQTFPDLGQQVVADGSAIKGYANPWRETVTGGQSDPEAGWTPIHSARTHNKRKDWKYGYQVIALADANHGIPLCQNVTPANVSENISLRPVIEKAESIFPWFQPDVFIGDRGYDSKANFEFLRQRGIEPIINTKDIKPGSEWGGLFTPKGTPTCVGKQEMEFVGNTHDGRRLYRCRTGGCDLLNSTNGGIRHCDSACVVDPTDNRKLFGWRVRRDSPEWKQIYSKRYSVERCFKSLKQSRRLEKCGYMGLTRATLHAVLAVLVGQATSLRWVRSGQPEMMRWMVAKIA